jgi:transcriptional regulator with XRE-family HTH domain
MTLGEKIHGILKERGISIQQFVDAIGIHRVSFNEYRIGKSNMKLETIIKSAQFLQISVDELIKDEAKGIEVVPYYDLPPKQTIKQKRLQEAQELQEKMKGYDKMLAEMRSEIEALKRAIKKNNYTEHFRVSEAEVMNEN